MRRAPVVFLLALVALLTLAAPAWAHTELARTSPAPGASVSTAPEAVTLTFTQEVDERLARVTVRDAAGTTVSTGQVQRDGLALVQPLQGVGPGRYEVAWRAAAADGHILRGTSAFRVRGGGGGGGDANVGSTKAAPRPSPEDYLRDHAKAGHDKPSYAISAADRRRSKNGKAAAAGSDAPGDPGTVPAPAPDNSGSTIVALLVAALGVTTVSAVIESVRSHRV